MPSRVLAALCGLLLCAGAIVPASADPAPPVHVRPGAATPSDEVLWGTIEDTGYVELYEFFLKEFPASRRAADAERAIAILNGEIDPGAVAAAEAGRAANGAANGDEAGPDETAAAAPVPDLDPQALDVARFQRTLRARGCNGGLDDGIWGERTAGAAQRFADALGLDVDPSWPNVALFTAVFDASGDVCGEI